MARLLVTGGAGFLGSHLCEALLDRGDEVVAVDNLVTGRKENVTHLLGHARFTFVEHDVCEPPDPLDRHGPYEQVLHLASPASPTDFERLPLEILAAGSVGTRNALDLCRRSGARFVLASTSEVYGDPAVHPQPESYWGNVDPIGPRSAYDEAKRFAEALTVAYRRVHGVDTRIARIFNSYGPRTRPNDGRVISAFIVHALTGQPLVVFGDGEQTRSFCYVDDEVAGILALADSHEPGPVNLGHPVECSIVELAGLVVELTGSSAPIEFRPLPPGRTGDPALRCPDITLARRALGWEPTTPLRDGLLRTIEWFRGELG